jgi:uncharacterized repeat protein (TIGR03803 family)
MKNGSKRGPILSVGVLTLFVLLTLCGNGAAQTFSVLVNFNGTNGSLPVTGSLTLGPDGNLWGATCQGGAYEKGTVFNMTPSGTLTTVYDFGSTPGDSQCPYAPPVPGADGNLYGTNLVLLRYVNVDFSNVRIYASEA